MTGRNFETFKSQAADTTLCGKRNLGHNSFKVNTLLNLTRLLTWWEILKLINLHFRMKPALSVGFFQMQAFFYELLFRKRCSLRLELDPMGLYLLQPPTPTIGIKSQPVRYLLLLAIILLIFTPARKRKNQIHTQSLKIVQDGEKNILKIFTIHSTCQSK